MDYSKYKNMTRRELLGELYKADQGGNKILAKVIIDLMARQQIDYGIETKQKRGFFSK
tara:strand:- start:7650 stop:7823 length:174 start_codon:yes stop_codon:yes gene_type:complete